MASVLIAYYSRRGQNYVNGDIKNLPRGNTELIAEMIQKHVGGELFEIDTVKEYPIDYTECTLVAKDELRQKTRPELKKYLDDVNQYDVIYLGYPCWWGLPPMAVFTFLERYDWKGKIIRPFSTHEGSGLGGSISRIKKACPGSEVKAGLAIHGADAARSEAAVVNWLNRSS